MEAFFAVKTLVLLVLLSLVAAARPATAFDVGWLPEDAFYTVPGLFVEETAETGVEAKAAAMDKAVRTGLERLLMRLVTRENAKKIAASASVDARQLVISMAISQESAQARSYRAEVDIRFKRDSVLRLIRRYGARYTESQSPPMLIMPVVFDGGRVDWDNDAWRKVWLREVDQHGIIPMRVFSASAEDRSYLSGNPLQQSQTNLGLMAVRHMTEYTAVVAIDDDVFRSSDDIQLRGGIGVSESEAQTVQISGFDAHGPFRIQKPFETSTEDPVSLSALASEIILELEDRWKSAAIGQSHRSVSFEEAPAAPAFGGIAATVLPRDRIAIEAALNSIPGVLDFSIGGGGFGEQAFIQFDGDLSLLRASLVRRGVIMVETDAGLQLAAY
ncbi:MAG: DUF2066 domain-containing protein [Pseudomonadota bacterium]